jgi:tetratricopeptide (TPR) repeat protein
MRMEADAESLLGNVAYEEEKAAEAAPHYREAASLLEAAGDTSGAARQLAAVGQALLAQGLASEATSQLQASVDRAPSDPVFQTQLAQALWHSGQGRAAVAVLGGVLGIDGANREALRLRGEILADLGDARDAILDLERQSIPDLPSTRAARGLALAKLGNHSAATKEIDEAVARAPRNGPVLLYAARASALTGDKVSTGELAKRAIDATDPPLSRSHLQVALKLSGR